MNKTRKVRRGGGFFDFLTGSNTPAGPTESNLKAKRNYNMAHSKSKVANILSKPGNFKYTNKERIQKNYESAIAELKKIEKPKETASALKTLASTMQTALESQSAKKAGAITITLPIGLAQLAFKAIMIFLAVMTFIFIDLGSFGQFPIASYFLPNQGFNTTLKAYNSAKQAIGVTN